MSNTMSGIRNTQHKSSHIKSPSDTTIYAPALQKQGNTNSPNYQRLLLPTQQCIQYPMNVDEQQNMLTADNFHKANQISDFVESIHYERAPVPLSQG